MKIICGIAGIVICKALVFLLYVGFKKIGTIPSLLLFATVFIACIVYDIKGDHNA